METNRFAGQVYASPQRYCASIYWQRIVELGSQKVLCSELMCISREGPPSTEDLTGYLLHMIVGLTREELDDLLGHICLLYPHAEIMRVRDELQRDAEDGDNVVILDALKQLVGLDIRFELTHRTRPGHDRIQNA